MIIDKVKVNTNILNDHEGCSHNKRPGYTGMLAFYADTIYVKMPE